MSTDRSTFSARSQPTTTPRTVLRPTTNKGRHAMQTARRGTASHRVQVAVRIRPMSRFDEPNSQEVVNVEDSCVVVSKDTERERRFNYDFVFTETQDVVYDCIGRPMLADAFDGYNVCLFAYGQTGSGKTYSILGPPTAPPQGGRDTDGIIPRFCRDMFALAQEKLEEDPTLNVKISMSYIEIYNEKVRDLLEKRKSRNVELSELDLRETPDKKVYVENLSVHTVINYERIKKLLDYGNSQRQVAEHKMNEASSRSHSIVRFYLSQTHTKETNNGLVEPCGPEKRDMESILTLVDLAGSERQSKTEATGEQFVESKNINRSLLMLGRALNSFSENSSHVPLRESKLTRLLSESFGGNARTWMLACVSPSAYNYSETISTLEYASNAKAITNKAKVNSIQQRLELNALREQYARLDALYNQEREKNKRLTAELDIIRNSHAMLTADSSMLKKSLQQSKQREDVLMYDLDTTRGKVSELQQATRQAQQLCSVPSREGDACMYIGRAKVSLRNIIEQTSNYLTLPLLTTADVVDTNQQPVLIVNIYPVDCKGCSTLDNVKGTPKDLLGHRVDFVVHILSAKGLPKKYSHCVYCKYVYKWAEKDSYKTTDVHNDTDPEFDFKKRFAFSKMNQSLVDYFMSDNVITFEVVGQANPETAHTN
eukprot:TRINITY_DN84209_c0_g1_i1.p1 TRINITY_DN84209_c0_g1~~TRINITY_DN84209_c0_g1_i1.p1  ORF type:complete len:663 (+),score=31.74 TRINITY_DN84209_c0_g1_i1:23-1990(+)